MTADIVRPSAVNYLLGMDFHFTIEGLGFRMMFYNSEQKNVKERIPKVSERIEDLQNSIANVTRFIDKAKRYT